MISSFIQGIVFILILAVVIGILFRYFLGIGIGAPYLPIHTKYLKRLFAKIDIEEGVTVMDLGSGDGKILREAAKRGAKVVGYELNPLLVWISRRRLKAWGAKARVYRQNLFDADISQADIIFIFGITGIMNRLAEKILKEAKADAQVISFAFQLEGLEEAGRSDIAFLYRLPHTREKKMRED